MTHNGRHAMTRSMTNLMLSLVAAGAALGAMALAQPEASASPYDQRDFPCQEDEVLGYAPEFGPDNVGCIHIDDLKG
ncbi:hypothetical protein CH25_gp19 [Mycobacterium phage EagleEye]|uniref:Uncharacterized protein n=1 Tax=Mycobacterium phage EagleEye TaxID=1429759 RepID=W0LN40_9CAUD|nr:hypothetical protein CH25_gp19 [Mycobacterium phage EagleEye]AHG23867.1 hypothetical protein PBI_EAGLEEYE_87 [Mycobacterium phage EagleEye]QDK03520.1 hypothetical protein SEA_LUCYEDI_86 [Mycobacterium phage Lucyedi]QNJ55887.1 hypothetical protein SEA_PAINTERBOY_85 [Mycobacterium phage PainterBoy]